MKPVLALVLEERVLFAILSSGRGITFYFIHLEGREHPFIMCRASSDNIKHLIMELKYIIISTDYKVKEKIKWKNTSK